MKYIEVKGARVNNLKSVDLKIPIHKITCFAGPSGSGKSSFAFHTLYAESKRRFLNSFPTYLKFFSDRPAPVDVDLIEPVLPVFGLPQINPVIGTRSTVSDVMHLTELVQNIYSSSAVELCPEHLVELRHSTFVDLIKEYIQKLEESDVLYLLTTKENFITYLKDSPFPNRSYNLEEKQINDFDKDDEFWELLRVKVKGVDTLNKKVEQYLKKKVPIYLYSPNLKDLIHVEFSSNMTCPVCDYQSYPGKNVSYFSPYNALGACDVCNGFGANLVYDEEKLLKKELSVDEGGAKFLEYKRFGNLIDDLKKEMKKEGLKTDTPLKKQPKKFYKLLYDGARSWCGLNALFDYLETKKYKASVRIFIRGIQKEEICTTCSGSRLNQVVHSYYLFKNNKTSYKDIWTFNIKQLHDYYKSHAKDIYISNEPNRKILKKIIKLLEVAIGVGLGHLKLNRKSKTVSAGEYQRLLLLKYLSYEGTGALFIFDEPSLGLSLKEQKVLFNSFQNLIDMKNTVVLVEHSKYFQQESDYLVMMGPKAGKYGGEIIYQGNFKNKPKLEIENKANKKKVIEVDRKWIKVIEPELYNKKYQDVSLPTNEIIHVTGPSGSGKSAIFVNVLASKLSIDFTGESLGINSGNCKKITYPGTLQNVLVIDANLNRYSSRSTVGSLTGLFTIVRKHFLKTPYAKSMALKDGHLSANSELGQCPSCEGKGVKIVEMQFLEDIILECEDCKGTKLKPLYSTLTDGKMTVYEAYSSPLSSVIPAIQLTPKYRRIWEFMKILKLDYLSLDRPVSSLSGGEKQRLYLLSKLEKEVKNSVIFFENISFGLSEIELNSLAKFLNELTELNNTIVIIDQDEFFKDIATHSIHLK